MYITMASQDGHDCFQLLLSMEEADFESFIALYCNQWDWLQDDPL